jgi:ATP-grasp domain-containing protein
MLSSASLSMRTCPVSRITIVADVQRATGPGVHPSSLALALRRHAFWPELARLHGWDLAFHDAAALAGPEPPNGFPGSLCWIDLPLLSRSAYRALVARAVSAGAARVLDLPDDVEQVLGLDRTYPILTRAGLPTPRTALLPLDDATAAEIDSPAAVRRLLTERIYGALFDANINPHEGVYVRGFSSSVKSVDPAYYFGNNQADIEATVFEVIRHLRGALEVGGLALREYLDLERIELPPPPGGRGTIRVPFEVRITVVGGRALLASYHGPYDALLDEPRRNLAAALLTRQGRVEEATSTLLSGILRAGLPENYVADLAFTSDGRPVLIELNPLYAAGYNVPAAHAIVLAALGADLARRAGYPALPPAVILETAAALNGAPLSEDSAAIWLLDALS